MRKLSVGFAVSLIIAGCGGGGGSDTTSKPASSQSPIITLSAITNEVFQGETVSLNWNVSNATSCTAGGSWSGNLSLSGNQTVTVSNSGNNTFTITCTNSNTSSNAQVVVSAKPIFTEINNSLIVDRPYDPTVASNTTYVDINGDKQDDLVVHLWSMENFGKAVGNTPCKSEIQIFIFNAGKFTNQTDQYLPGNRSLGGCSRKHVTADINKDGKMDVIYAVNQEDGRMTANMYDIFAPMAALVSTGSSYVIRQFGTPSWYHSIGIGYNTKNELFVNGNGFTSVNNKNSFHFDMLANHSVSLLSTPSVSPTTFQFYNSSLTSTWTNYLLQASNSNTDYTTVEGYEQNSNGIWNKVNSLTLAPKVGSVNNIAYNGESGGVQPVFKLNNKNITIAGLVESCTLKLSPNSEAVSIFMLAGAIIPNFTEGMTVEQNALKDGISVLKGVKIVNGNAVEVPLNIKNEQTDKLGNNFDCKDINNDNYMDIVVYPFTENGLPLVYVNNKNNGFDYLDMSKYIPSVNLGWGKAASSIVNDFDKDGILDVILFPSNPYSSKTPTAWKFYKGQKALSLN